MLYSVYKENKSAFLHQKALSIIEEIGKAIIGKDDVIRKVLMAILAQGHVLLEDAPGVGKGEKLIFIALPGQGENRHTK